MKFDMTLKTPNITVPSQLGSRIHRRPIGRGVTPYDECPNNNTKQSDGWGMWSTPSLPSLPGPL